MMASSRLSVSATMDNLFVGCFFILFITFIVTMAVVLIKAVLMLWGWVA